jgi:hypothetical protein
MRVQVPSLVLKFGEHDTYMLERVPMRKTRKERKMKIKRGTLRKLINEVIGSSRMMSIEVDWVGDINELEGTSEELTFELVDVNGPGGWPVIRITGDRDAMRNWYVNVYSGGAYDAEDDFYDLYT